MSTSKITVNGKEYNSLSEIPDEYKVVFKDENNNGIPDMVEGILSGMNDLNNPAVNKSGSSSVNVNFTTFFYNGQQYGSLDQLPTNAKQMVEKGLASLEKSGTKIMTPVDNSNSGGIAVNQNSSNEDAIQELQPGFKFRVIMTIILFVLAVIYIIWLTKII
jgi:hypothetical protein